MLLYPRDSPGIGEPGLENPEPDANTLGSCLWLHQAGAGGQWREWPVSSLDSGWAFTTEGKMGEPSRVALDLQRNLTLLDKPGLLTQGENWRPSSPVHFAFAIVIF